MKILWDFNIQVDKFIEARRPDIILIRKKKIECLIIDIAVRVILEPSGKKMKKLKSMRS